MIILQCRHDQCRLNAHSVDPHSMGIESWSSVDRPYLVSSRLCRPCVTSDPYAAGLTFACSAFTGPTRDQKAYVRYIYIPTAKSLFQLGGAR